MIETRFLTYFGPNEIRTGSRRFLSLHTAAPLTGPMLFEIGVDMNVSRKLKAYAGWRWRGRPVEFPVD